jgi:hypothetical protein
MQLKRALQVLTGKHSIIVVLATLVALDALLVAAAFFPIVNNILTESNTFQVVVITCLIQVLLLLAARALRETPVAIGLDDVAKRRISELIEEDENIVSVKVLSAGLRTRADFMRSLLEHPRKMEVSIVACFSEANPDDLDREKYGPPHFSVLTHRLEAEEASRLKVYQSFNTPSVRCVVLSSATGPRHAFLGWYTYSNRNKHIQGRRNVQFQVDGTTAFGIDMLHFANNAFEKHRDDSEAELIWPP